VILVLCAFVSCVIGCVLLALIILQVFWFEIRDRIAGFWIVKAPRSMCEP